MEEPSAKSEIDDANDGRVDLWRRAILIWSSEELLGQIQTVANLLVCVGHRVGLPSPAGPIRRLSFGLADTLAGQQDHGRRLCTIPELVSVRRTTAHLARNVNVPKENVKIIVSDDWTLQQSIEPCLPVDELAGD